MVVLAVPMAAGIVVGRMLVRVIAVIVPMPMIVPMRVRKGTLGMTPVVRMVVAPERWPEMKSWPEGRNRQK